MGKRALLENKNMKKAIGDCTDSLNEFYLSEELVADASPL